jgi:hypothetical protein
MIVPGSTNPLLMRSAAVAAYQISRSLRFDASNTGDPPYVSRTFTSTGNRRTFTFSCWVKKSGVDSTKQYALLGRTGNSFVLQFDANSLKVIDTGSITAGLVTAAVFRDPSAWYHVVMSVDTTQATASNRVRLYINGVQQTLSGTQPTQNSDLNINTNVTHRIGATGTSIERVLDGYLADIYFLDGTATTPSTFAETNATTGAWNPITPASITYGTNGFHLDFSDNSGTTSTTLGKDSSGNNNDWNPSNFSVTAGSGNDSLTDTPTSYGTDTGTGAEVRGNYATLNPLAQSSGTFSNGNLEYIGPNNFKAAPSTILLPSTGKFYVEATLKAAPNGTTFGGTWAMIGVIAPSAVAAFSYNTGTSFFVTDTGQYSNYNTGTSGTIGTFASGTVVGLAINRDTNQVTVYQDGTSKATVTLGITSGADLYVFSGSYGSSYGQMACNFGQRAFAYTAPSGFKALVDTNLTAPTIAKPSTAFDVVTYTGTGSALTPTSSLDFSPDLTWIKSRSAATDNTLYDTVRGAEKRLESNTTDAEVTSDGGVTAFNSNGFTLGTLAQVNTNAATYVGWCWDGGTSTVTNTNGTITSSVRANASAGISIVTATTSNTSTQTFGHGLGVAPAFHIIKLRNYADDWYVYHSSLGATKFLKLNRTDAAATTSSVYDNTAPSSTVITLGSNWTSSLYNIVAYCFAPVSGFSSFGSYTGNGSADGPFVYLGFRPGWILVKASSTGGSTYDWFVYDTERDTYNAASKFLSPNYSGAEQATADAGTLTDVYFDILSNGFKVRNNRGRVNLNATTFVYAAFAEYPFAYARAR